MPERFQLWHLRCHGEGGLLELTLLAGLGGGRDRVRLLVGHFRQPCEHVAQIREGIDLQAPAVLDDREQDRSALPRFHRCYA